MSSSKRLQQLQTGAVLCLKKKVGGRVNYLKRFTSLLGGSTLPLSRTLKVNPGC